MTGFHARGGARIGWLNASWPLASLKAIQGELSLNVFPFGHYRFLPENVVSLEKYGRIPRLGQGLKINHNVHEYPEKIVFWCLGDPDRLISGIEEAGFQHAGRPPAGQARRGTAVRWQVILGVILAWYALFYTRSPYADSHEPGSAVLLALLLFTLIPLGIKHNRTFQRIFLKDGRRPEEIKAWLNFFPVLTGMMFVFFLVSHLIAGG